MKLHIKQFNELNLNEFYEIIKLRIEVFVVEQNCPYQEVDDIDKISTHLWLSDENDKIIAYSRIFTENKDIHFGRVIVAKNARGSGVSNKLLNAILKFINEKYPNQDIKIGAQAHLQKMYSKFGFEPIGEIYLEDGIPHIDMKIKKNL